MIKKTNTNNLPPTDTLDSDIFAAMAQEGWLIPQTVEDVIQAERELQQAAITLPAELRDPAALLKRAAMPLRLVRAQTPSSDNSAVENLARAARNGTLLSPEVEERMKKDREKVERKDNG
jgi:hypothetical protein